LYKSGGAMRNCTKVKPGERRKRSLFALALYDEKGEGIMLGLLWIKRKA